MRTGIRLFKFVTQVETNMMKIGGSQRKSGYYQKEQQPPEKKVDLESMLTIFMEALEKIHD